MDPRENADRTADDQARAGAAQAVVRDPDDRRNRERDNRRGDLRLRRDACQDRNRRPCPEADLGIAQSGQHAHPSACGGASTGLDVLSHAIESYTAMDYRSRPAPARPKFRPAYQGANPISDLWALASLGMVRTFLPRAVEDPADDEARGMMLLAASYAGIGFGNAGVHLTHGMSYPVSGMVKNFQMPGYPTDHAMVPHGVSVILNAPAVFRFTAPASPERHLAAAAALGAEVGGTDSRDAGTVLADTIVSFMRRLGAPSGLEALGYTEADIPALVEGTLPQHRVTKISPRKFSNEQLAGMFQDAMRSW